MNKYCKNRLGKWFIFTSILPGENLDYLELAAEVFVYYSSLSILRRVSCTETTAVSQVWSDTFPKTEQKMPMIFSSFMWNLHQYGLWRWTWKCRFGCVSKLPAVEQIWILLPQRQDSRDRAKQATLSPVRKMKWAGSEQRAQVQSYGARLASPRWKKCWGLSLLHKWQDFMGTPTGMDLQGLGTGNTNGRVRRLGCLLYLYLNFACCISDYIHRVYIIYYLFIGRNCMITIVSYREVLGKQMNIHLLCVHALKG